MDWVGAVLSGAFKYFGAKAQEKSDKAKITLENKEQYNWSTRGEAFSAALEDYYKQRDLNEKRKAMGEYEKFSSLSRWAPGYTNTYQPPATPAMPTPADIAKKNPGAT